MPKLKNNEAWVNGFKMAIRSSTAKGWTVREHRGLARLEVRTGEGMRSAQLMKNNIPFSLSTVSCTSVEEVGKHLNGTGWFQLYPPADKAIRNDLLKRAKNSGFKTLIITADIPASSRRERLRMAGVSVPPKNNIRTFFQAAICPIWSINTLINGIPAFGTMDQYSDGTWHGNAKSKAGFAGSQMQRY